MIMADGFQIFDNVDYSCWMIMLQILTLPPHVRTHDEFSLLVGIVPGPTSPSNLSNFLRPLQCELITLHHGNFLYLILFIITNNFF